MMTKEQLVTLLRRECDKAGGQKAWAKQHGVAQSYVSDILAGNRGLGPHILRALQFAEVVTYRKVGSED